MKEYTSTLRELSQDPAAKAGHKAHTLSRLLQTGFPTPDGFVVLPSAFVEDRLRDEAWTQVQAHLVRLRRREPRVMFAVRSSALAEDSAHASFAGAFETVLGVRDDDEVHSALLTVRQSRRSERVQAYRLARRIEQDTTIASGDPGADFELAVIVQRLVQAELSGVLFTADPVTGDRSRMVGDAVHGFGDRLVSGQVAPVHFTLSPTVSRFKIWTRVLYEGPIELEEYARRLHKLGKQLEQELGGPQDIEWAMAEKKLFILQSRPITTMMGFDPITGEFNDSLTGDYVWSCVNLGEAVSVVMTPITWSVMRAGFGELDLIPGHPAVGNIGGRLYQNSTVMVSVLNALGKNFVEMAKEIGGVRDEYLDTMDQFLVPLPEATPFSILPKAIRVRRKEKRALKNEAEFLAENPSWCREMRERIQSVHATSQLERLMTEQIVPRSLEAFWRNYATALRYSERVGPLRRELVKLVGAADADALLSNVSSSGELLASLGPVVGLARVARGEISRIDYLEQWGHRGELETEVSAPRPAEDPSWLDRQLSDFAQAPVDVEAMLADKRVMYSAAWQRFEVQHPRRARSVKRRLKAASAAARAREAARSESVRIIWVVRDWVICAGDLAGIGDGAFFLTLNELQSLLAGKGAPTSTIPARKQSYARYKTLPPYPLTIRGRFDPFSWAEDPDRDTRQFDSHGLLAKFTLEAADKNVVLGVPGSAGSAEGLVRRLDSPEKGNELQIGEILVSSQTNIGWTLFFPKAAAIVTDIGAPLSHAAIVARELGIPAVVNCGDATTRLRTGDRVRVDGTSGTVQILEREI